MSWMPGAKPDLETECPDELEMVIIPRAGDLGGFKVHRALPFRRKQMVGPFIFWDQMGPGEFLTGQGLDVRPHPHIGLSTITYLFDGSMHHRDSLGTDQTILPGSVNLMTAGRGIVHSERTGAQVREAPSSLFGIQSWLALPKTTEEGEPAFHHGAKADLPWLEEDGQRIRLLMGEAYGLKSPVPSAWDTLYMDVELEAGKTFSVPKDAEERAIYILSGRLELAGSQYDPQQMLILKPKNQVVLTAVEASRFMVLGGAAMDGPRHVWWNFVASSKDLLEKAKEDWKSQSFPSVPGDGEEFIPLPQI